MTDGTAPEKGHDFIRDIVAADIESGRRNGIVTRFPPEPNGYLHIGHAKSIALNFGIAQEFAGRCHLRFDDTNPTREEQEYIDSIQADVRWLGYDWGSDLFYASDYFERLYGWAEQLIIAGLAYVDDQSQEEIRIKRGTLTEPGQNSPFRDRAVAENLDLFRRMKAGEFQNGARVLRARIDMSSGNINLRDPVLYRILHATHPRTGDKWSIYPSYDYAHGQSDAIEGITHSICTLEFEDHRPLYDWLLDKLPVPSRPHQYEFARLNLTYTLLSKRVLTELVRGGHVSGWDDPRMPTIAGLKRRGVPPAAIREFVKRIGVAKANSVVDVGMLEFCIREILNKSAQRRMAVLRPLKVVIENYPEGESEELEAVNHPDDPTAGTRRIAFGRELYIERDDFMENPPKKFFRLSPGTEVRLRYAYFVTCREVVKNAAGEVTELRCSYDPATRGGNAPDGRKVKATMHWLPAKQSMPAEIRIYNQLFAKPTPDAANFAADLNPQSLEILSDARIEPGVAASNANEVIQFERQGYFVRDKDSTPQHPVFNRTIGLRDTFAKEVGADQTAGKTKPTRPDRSTEKIAEALPAQGVSMSQTAEASTQKTLSVSEQLLHSTIRIECRKANGDISSGTGFHFRFSLKNSAFVPSIITNKHVFADAVECAIHMTLADEYGNSLNKHERIVITGFTRDTWIGHPDAEVDLAVLPIQSILAYMDSRKWRPFFVDVTPDLIPSAEDFRKLSPLEDITMIGYPNGIWDDVNNFPIVRRGITATGCYSDYRGRTDFLIDAAVFPGSSGSPVFIYNQGSYSANGGIALGTRLLFIGILYAVHLHTAQGEIKIVTIPTGSGPMAFSHIPNNLGICVRSTRILDFQDILQKRVDAESTSVGATTTTS